LAAACVAIPFVAAAASLSVSFVNRTTYAPAFHEDFNRGCDNVAPLGDPSRARCNFSITRPLGRIVLIGDSNAGQFTEPVVAAARRLHYDLSVVTLSECPFVQLRFWTDSELVACGRHNAGSLRAAERTRPSLMIIAGRTDTWLNDSSLAVAYGHGSFTRAAAAKERLYERALHDELVQLARHRIPVVLIHPVPQLAVDQPSCAPVLFLFGGCTGDASQAAVDSELSRAIAAERRAARGVPGVSLLSFEREVCDARRCSAQQGVPMYRNVDHLSVVGALTLTRRFVRVIRANAKTDQGARRASASR
jgi:hypothetical protein